MEVKLSPIQKSIVEDTDGAFLLTAAAGSGKTRVLTERIKYLLNHKKGHYRILALTYTNKAAEEMRERLDYVENLSDKVYIGTLHRFCLEIIKSRGKLIGLDSSWDIFESIEDRQKVLEKVINNNPYLKQVFFEENNSNQSKKINNILEKIAIRKRQLQFDNYQEDEDFNLVYEEYNNALLNQNAFDYDDILLYSYRVLVEAPNVAEFYQRLYKYICIDEAQDLTYVQYQIVKLLTISENPNILMVGDPNQAVFGFAGADKKIMTELFVKEFQPKQQELTDNYRSARAILKVANKLKSGYFEIKGNLALEGEFSIESFKNEIEEAEWVIKKIEYLCKNGHPDIEGKIALDKIAILARNRYVFKHLQKQLEQGKIVYHYKRTNEQIESESDLMKIFELGLRIILNPINQLHFQKICAILKINKQLDSDLKSGIQKLNSLSELLPNEIDIKYKFEIVSQAWSVLENSNPQFQSALDILKKYANNLEDDNDKALILEDIKEWENLWIEYELQSIKDRRSLQQFRSYLALGITQNSQKDIGLTLASVHAAKGLEFDIVFLIGMTEGTFPDFRAKTLKALEEEKNALFVSITRSKRLLYVTYPNVKLMSWGDEKPQQYSRFIRELSLIES